MGYDGVYREWYKLLGELMRLDESIKELKELSKEIPFHLYDLNTREVNYLKKILDIINKLEVPLKIEHGKA